MLGRRWDDAVAELGQSLAIGRRIEYPTLTWQAADLLARAQAAAGHAERAAGTAQVAVETIDLVACACPVAGPAADLP
jgi:hypothetical protein